MDINEMLRKIETLTITLQSTRNEMAALGVERDVLDRLDKVIGDARSYVRMDTLTTGITN